jgi:hypothetical protein
MRRTPAVALLLLVPAVAIACGSTTPITPSAQEVKTVTASPDPPRLVQSPFVIVQQPVPVAPQAPRVYYPPPANAGGVQYPTKTDVLVRSGPGTSYSAVSSISAGGLVVIDCQALGEHISGPAGGSSLWDRTSSPSVGYVSDEFIATGTTGTTEQVAPSC